MDELAGERLKKDPRVAQAKRLIHEAIADAKGHITGVRGPDPARAPQFEMQVKEVKEVRGMPLWYPYISGGLGKGSLVELADGSVKLDYVNGIGVHPGHSLPELTEASLDAALEDTIMQGNLQQSAPALSLMRRFVELSGFDHCYLSTSGAMACENALKMCFQKNFPRSRLLALRHCFMGRTCTLAQVTDKAAYRVGLPTNIPVDYIPLDEERALDVLEEHLKRYPDQHAALTMELVQGEGGFYTASPELFHRLIDRAREAGILVIIDEVQTFGRTLELFAFQHFGLANKVDVVTIGKLAQVCATLYNKELVPGPGLISGTFTSSAAAIYAAHTLLDRLLEGNRYGPDGQHHKLHNRFVQHLEKLEHVSGPFGLGLMVAFTPFDGSPEKVKALLMRLYEHGLICFPCGTEPSRIRLLAPILTTSEGEIDQVMSILKRSLREVASC